MHRNGPVGSTHMVHSRLESSLAATVSSVGLALRDPMWQVVLR